MDSSFCREEGEISSDDCDDSIEIIEKSFHSPDIIIINDDEEISQGNGDPYKIHEAHELHQDILRSDLPSKTNRRKRREDKTIKRSKSYTNKTKDRKSYVKNKDKRIEEIKKPSKRNLHKGSPKLWKYHGTSFGRGEYDYKRKKRSKDNSTYERPGRSGKLGDLLHSHNQKGNTSKFNSFQKGKKHYSFHSRDAKTEFRQDNSPNMNNPMCSSLKLNLTKMCAKRQTYKAGVLPTNSTLTSTKERNGNAFNIYRSDILKNNGEKDVDDPEYAHLLLEYGEIKNSLDTLEREENNSPDHSSIASNNNLDQEIYKSHKSEVEKDLPNMNNNTDVIDMEIASSEDEGGIIKENERIDYIQDEDEQLLRAELLASLAQRRREKQEKQENKETQKEDFDEQLLRAQLLASLAQRQEEKERQKEKSEKDLKELELLKNTDTGTKFIEIPKHKPVIIKLGEESSDDDDNDEPVKKSDRGVSPDSNKQFFLGRLDTFLKEARRSIEQKEQEEDSMAKSESLGALKHLGPYNVLEYKKLKEEIKKRENHKIVVGKENSTTEDIKKVNVHKENSPHQPIEVKQVDIKTTVVEQKISSIGQEEVKSQQSIQVKKPTDHTNVEDKSVQDVRKVEMQHNSEKTNVTDIGIRATLHMELIEQDQQKLDYFNSIINQKNIVIKTAKQKIQKLREQMQAAQRAFRANLEQITKLTEESKIVQSRIDKRKVKLLSLEKEVSSSSMSTMGRIDILSANYRTSPAFNKLGSKHRNTKKVWLHIMEKRLRLAITDYKIRKNLNGTENAVSSATKSNQHIERDRHTAPSMNKIDSSLCSNTTHGEREKLIGDEANMRAEEQIISKLNVDTVGCSKLRDARKNLRKRSLSSNSSYLSITPNEPEHIQTEETMYFNKIDNVGKCSEKNQDTKKAVSKNGCTTTDISVAENINFSVIKPSSTDFEEKSSIFNPLWSATVHGHLDNIKDEQANMINIQLQTEFHAVQPVVKYSGHLLRFKSYRFSPYFRTKFGIKLTSITYSNKLNSAKIMCRFDLTGKCIAQNCPWQHEVDYSLQNVDSLQDLVSYGPELSGTSKVTPMSKYPQLVSHFGEQFSKQNKNMTVDHQCILLASRVNEKTKHIPPHTTRLEPRKWKPLLLSNKKIESDTDDTVASTEIVFTPMKIKENNTGKRKHLIADDHLSEQDVRYWRVPLGNLQFKHSVDTCMV